MKPLLFHYVIGTCDVKQRSHADNIIIFWCGRRGKKKRCGKKEVALKKTKGNKKQVDTKTPVRVQMNEIKNGSE